MSSIYSTSAAIQASQRADYDERVEYRVQHQAFMTELAEKIAKADSEHDFARLDGYIETFRQEDNPLLQGLIDIKISWIADRNAMAGDMEASVKELAELDTEIENHPGNPANLAEVIDLTQEDDETACSEADPEDLESVTEMSVVIQLPSAGLCAPPRPFTPVDLDSDSDDEGQATFYMGPSTSRIDPFSMSPMREDSDTEADDSFALDVELLPLREAVMTHSQQQTTVPVPVSPVASEDAPPTPRAVPSPSARVTRSKSKEAPAFNTRSSKRPKK